MKNNPKAAIINDNEFIVIAGPCAVETREQINESARFLHGLGIKYFRAGAFKPRTKADVFQGAGKEGLVWLNEIKIKYGLKIVSEITSLANLPIVAEVADVIQIGAKSMYDKDLLIEASKYGKPILLKRHFAATVREYISMTDFITNNYPNVDLILCERGIRTFEDSTRFTIDFGGAAVIQRDIHYPLIIDPSHAMGLVYGIDKISLAAVSFGSKGIIIEVHPCPSEALCDRDQALSNEEFSILYQKIKSLVEFHGKKII